MGEAQALLEKHDILARLAALENYTRAFGVLETFARDLAALQDRVKTLEMKERDREWEDSQARKQV